MASLRTLTKVADGVKGNVRCTWWDMTTGATYAAGGYTFTGVGSAKFGHSQVFKCDIQPKTISTSTHYSVEPHYDYTNDKIVFTYPAWVAATTTFAHNVATITYAQVTNSSGTAASRALIGGATTNTEVAPITDKEITNYAGMITAMGGKVWRVYVEGS